MFCDSDFIFPHDLSKLFDYCRGYPDKALMTVQFDWQPEEGAVKMDGRQQSQYSRKLWSSLMMINMNHPVQRQADNGGRQQCVRYTSAQFLLARRIGDRVSPRAMELDRGGQRCQYGTGRSSFQSRTADTSRLY
jgi:hypothetical protein